MMKQKDLALQLSQLHSFAQPSARLEQYATDSEIAAQLLWSATLQGDVQRKTLADFGCGNGILGLGALLLGAGHVFFVDIDPKALSLAKENLHLLEQRFDTTYSATFLNISVEDFHERVDIVIQNPPFGVQQEHADRLFLTCAMTVADVIYTIHKIESTSFIASLAQDHSFHVRSIQPIGFPLKKTQTFHRKKVHLVSAGIWRLERHRKV